MLCHLGVVQVGRLLGRRRLVLLGRGVRKTRCLPTQCPPLAQERKNRSLSAPRSGAAPLHRQSADAGLARGFAAAATPPFATATLVYANYCDGGSWAGHASQPVHIRVNSTECVLSVTSLPLFKIWI